MQDLKELLVLRRYLVTDNKNVNNNTKYYNAYLLSNFGIVVDKPQLLTKDHVDLIAKTYHLNVPKSFYANPQDTKYFTNEELLVEQIVSYFAYASDLGRIEIFKKDLPQYVEGEELKLRTFNIVNSFEATTILKDITKAYCAYTRPFSESELDEFIFLYKNNFYENDVIKCKDNIFYLLPYNKEFASFLDRKDIVKLSISMFGAKASFKNAYDLSVVRKQLAEIAEYIPYVKVCPMTKKQAKYYNKLLKLCKLYLPRATNAQSPDRLAKRFIDNGNIIEAARVYANNGSMLERHIKMLLARANPVEAVEILNMLPTNNPIALYQLMTTLSTDDGSARTFTFFNDKKVKKHTETEYESMYRKSALNESTRTLLFDTCMTKIKNYYKALPALGNVFIDDNFYKIALPTNTSASGKGIDVIPTGSRIPCNGKFIRTFVHWKDAFDIDSSLIVVKADGTAKTMGWFSYSDKPFGNDILFSGDITSKNGAEYYDIDLEALKKHEYKYVIQTFHGYLDKLNTGEIYAGYQNKDNLNTRAWDPKNIEMQFRVQGDTRACIAFAIDIETNEIIILNQMLESDSRIVQGNNFDAIKKYLSPDYLKMNIGEIIEARGNLVIDPTKADFILSDSVKPILNEESSKDTTIIRSWETEKLVKLINE